MKTYCITCKKETDNYKETVKAKNNKLIFRSVCKECKKNKSRFYSYKGGSFDIHSKLLPLLPKKGLTLPGYNYCGPGNPLDNGAPTNELDAICQRHDYCYSKENTNKNDCDQTMLNEMKNSKSSSIGEKISKYLIVKPIIYSKYKLGLGTKPKKPILSHVPTNTSIKWSDKLAEELHKPIIKKFPLRRVMVYGPNEIWSADLIDMKEFSKDNKNYNYLLNVIDIFSKYAWSIPLKTKTALEVTKAFSNILTKKNHPKKLWVDQGSEFYNTTFDALLKKYSIEIYHTFNEGKAVIVERFNRTLKNTMYKYFTANNTHKYIDALDRMIKKYNNTFHSSIKMKPKDAVHNKNITKVFNALYREPIYPFYKFNVGDKVRIVKKKKTFEKGYTPNWTEEIFIITDQLNTSPVTYTIKDLKGENIEGSFYEPELQKTSQEVFRIEKVIKQDTKKKLALVKWMGYDERFNSWVKLSEIKNI